MNRKLKNFLKATSRVIFRSKMGRILLSHAVAGYIRLVGITSQIQRNTTPEAELYMRGEKAAIFTFWHGRLLMMSYFRPPQRKLRALVSIHRDGEWLVETLARFDIGLVRGSSNRGGHAALREALQVLQSGENVVITPDGPRGPVEVAQQGAVALASMTGLPIIPVSMSASRCRQLGSWDRFMIPWPFTRMSFAVGAPIFVQENVNTDELDRASEALTHALRQLTREVDARVAR